MISEDFLILKHLFNIILDFKSKINIILFIFIEKKKIYYLILLNISYLLFQNY